MRRLVLMVAVAAWAGGAVLSAPEPQNGLAAHYTFDEQTDAAVRDAGPNKLDGAVHGATWAKRDNGGALEFDGKSAYVDCGAGSRLNLKDQLTIAVQIYPKGAPSGEPVIVGERPSSWGMTHYKGFAYLYAKSPDKYNYCQAPVPYHQWSHVVGTFDGSSLKLYVNGALQARATLAAPISLSSASKLLIGGGNEADAFYCGLIDEVRIYTRVLADAEIAELAAQANLAAGSTALRAEEIQAADKFFKSHPRGAAVVENGRQVWLANESLGVEFVKEKKSLRLSRLYDVAAAADFLAGQPGGMDQGLWKLVLRRDKGANEAEVTVDSGAEAEVSTQTEQGAGETTLRLIWKNLPVLDERDALDVEVRVVMKAGDPLSRWRIAVTNRSKTYGLWSVFFPVLSLSPVGGKSETNAFAIGRARGVVVKDPFNDSNKYSFGFGANYECYWPGTFNMQLQALYDESSGRGIYLGVHDRTVNRKAYIFTPSPARKALEWKVGHFPANMGYAAEDFRMDYDACIGPFTGDWYDACQIYRAWAVHQPWCQRGPLATRTDIPRWFKECPLMLVTMSFEGDPQVVRSRDRMLEDLRFFGGELPVVWYTWKKHFPEKTEYNRPGSPWQVPEKRAYPCGNIHDGNYPTMPALETFSEACKKIGAAGGHVQAYVCSSIFDPGINENAPFAAQAKPNASRDVKGNLVAGDPADVSVGWQMCAHTPWWQQRLKETVVELIKREGVGGIYFDTFYGGYCDQCFDTKHGHSHGGGIDPYLGEKKLSAVVRGAMKETDPNSVMTGESCAESAIDLVDGLLYRWTVWPDMAPMFATVYGGYITRQGATLSPESDGFYIQCATLFTEGAQMGRFHLHADDYLKDFDQGSKYTEKMKFLRKLTQFWRMEAGSRYLAYGQLLRPIRFLSPNPMPMASYVEPECKDYRNGLICVPGLQSGAFRAENGNLGIFLVNVTDKPIEYKLELPPKLYPVLESETYQVTQISETGERLAAGPAVKGRVAHAGVVAAHDTVFLEARAQKQ